MADPTSTTTSNDPPLPEVFVVGGYGVFGRRLCRLLRDRGDLRLVVAGRSLDRAAAFVAELGPDAPSCPRALSFDARGDAEAVFRGRGTRVVLDLSGPFQGSGTGLAEAMVEAVMDHAWGKVEQILISVIEENKRARRFYEKMGFELYGLERHALKIDGRYYDEEFRVKFLGENRPG